MINNHIKIAWRNAQKNKSFTAISLFSLVLGITLFFVISIWVDHEMSYDKSIADAELIYRLESELLLQDGTNSSLQTVGWPVGRTLVEKYPEIDAITYMRSWSPVISSNNNKYYEEGLWADENFFSVFDFKLEEGDPSKALSEPNSIILTPELKQKYFGGSQAMGQVMMLSDTIPYKVTGILKKVDNPSHLKFGLIGSFSTVCSNNPNYCEEQYVSGWFDVNVFNYMKLKPGVKKGEFEAKVKTVVTTYGKEAVERTGFKTSINMRPLNDIYLKSGMPTGYGTIGNIKTVRLFFGVGVFILLLACLNFINLTTASSLDRAKEIGIKKVLGSNRKNLIKQFLTEAALFCLIAGLISAAIIILILPYFNQYSGKEFTIIDLFTIKKAGMLLIILLSLIPLAGFYPAWVISSFKPVHVLKGQLSQSLSGNTLRKGLVVFQFVVSIAFIMSTMVIGQQMSFMQNENLGFDRDKIIMVDVQKVPWSIRHNNAEVFKNSLKAVKGISEVSGSAAIPGRTGWGGQFAYPEGRSKDESLIVEYIPVDYEYVSTLGLELEAGRDFLNGSQLDAEKALLINETAVKSFGWKSNEDAIGKKLATSGKEARIIGVLKDYHQHGLQSKINPVVLGVANFIRLYALRYEGIGEKEAIAHLEKAWNDVYGDYPLEYSFMDEVLQKQYEKEEKLSSFFQLATILSILIACLGLLGLSIYTARKRVKEIGVRKVLGASVVNIVGLFSKDFLKLVLIAVIVAMPIAWISMDNWLQDYAYSIDPPIWVFVISGILALVIAFITIGYHSLNAAIANPTKSLRTE